MAELCVRTQPCSNDSSSPKPRVARGWCEIMKTSGGSDEPGVAGTVRDKPELAKSETAGRKQATLMWNGQNHTDDINAPSPCDSCAGIQQTAVPRSVPSRLLFT